MTLFCFSKFQWLCPRFSSKFAHNRGMRCPRFCQPTYSRIKPDRSPALTLILLMWNIGWAPNNTSKWQMGFNSAFNGLKETLCSSGFSGLEVMCWPLIHKFAGSHPAEAVRSFREKKILSTPYFGGEVKPSVPCRNFTTCKRYLNVTCKLAFRQNYPPFLAHSSTFRRWVHSRGDTRGDAWWRKLERLTKIAQ